MVIFIFTFGTVISVVFLLQSFEMLVHLQQTVVDVDHEVVEVLPFEEKLEL